jgi:predicted transcriptional regulator
VEELCDLLFELSNEDRLRILFELEKENLKLSHIAKRLDFTVQETSRNLTRLSKAQLVEKTSEGSYKITSYGLQSIRMLSGYQFLSTYSDYFSRHDLSYLPTKFLTRLGELMPSQYVSQLMESFGLVEKMLAEAEEYYLYMAKEPLVSGSGIILARNALDKGVKGRGIEPIDFVPSEKIMMSVSDEVLKDLASHRLKGNVEHRFLESVDVSLFMNEKEVVYVFPDLNGEFNFQGFTSTDPKTLEWCRELFDYYWGKGVQKIA